MIIIYFQSNELFLLFRLSWNWNKTELSKKRENITCRHHINFVFQWLLILEKLMGSLWFTTNVIEIKVEGNGSWGKWFIWIRVPCYYDIWNLKNGISEKLLIGWNKKIESCWVIWIHLNFWIFGKQKSKYQKTRIFWNYFLHETRQAKSSNKLLISHEQHRKHKRLFVQMILYHIIYIKDFVFIQA